MHLPIFKMLCSQPLALMAACCEYETGKWQAQKELFIVQRKGWIIMNILETKVWSRLNKAPSEMSRKTKRARTLLIYSVTFSLRFFQQKKYQISPLSTWLWLSRTHSSLEIGQGVASFIFRGVISLYHSNPLTLLFILGTYKRIFLMKSESSDTL